MQKLSALLVSILIITMVAGCEAKRTNIPVTESPAAAADFKQALEQPVTVSAAQSPDGNRLTVQFAAMEICKAAGNVPYQFEKSQQLAGQDCRRFIESINVTATPAKDALTNLLTPLNLRYEVDDKGVYLTK